MKLQKIELDGQSLTLEHLDLIAHQKAIVSLSASSVTLMKKSREYVDNIVKSGKVVYGINTGFGALSSKKIDHSQLSELQYNLIRSHCTGVGNPLEDHITRMLMALRINCLASGFSGVSIECIELLIELLNRNILPFVPEKGSVGASGDLAPLAHMALILIGEGKVKYKGQYKQTNEVFKEEGLQACTLHAKDGLALINGTAMMMALLAHGLIHAKNIMKVADISSAITLEVTRGTLSAFDPDIAALKPHPGQMEVVDNFKQFFKMTNEGEKTQIQKSHEDCDKVQDPYSLRCVQQVHGAARQTLEHAQTVLEREINAVTDNPLIFVEKDKVISGGNFHGEALALAMDYLAMGLSEIANISERRVEKMMNPSFSGLDAFLIKDGGLNSGLMITHVTMAALVSENKSLCHPASVDSIPTSTDKEDHVSMGVHAGLKLKKVIENVYYCLAIEILSNTQGLYLLSPLKSSPLIEFVYDKVRQKVAPIDKDRIFYDDINEIFTMIASQEIVQSVESKFGAIK